MASLRVRAAVVFAGCCLTALSTGCLAQFTAAERAAYMSGLRIDRGMLAGPLASSPRSAMSIGGPSDYYGGQETRELNLLGTRGVLVEMPRVQPDGRYERPRVLIGRHSPELHAWMKQMGLPPERCMLPMFRGRLKRDPDTGKAGAAVLVSARCTFY
jgi:hypothetical protein